ncbi:hypothetical protein C5L33_000875 [Lactobacillus pasteurii]|uniref:Uncharacterized protein n=1 Tax=Lactobacillus pasteurii DSM 23907 = CRBIP 24.76 TaxID=1423790 RepID=I7LAA2_9LACO|nr:hypothetical protein C5L33_000875 [Lactobacillus pasteurii]CCI84506.1 Protein of unknown function [Lactobacillus pasteurii DSM 23907 = CRBIP 24.76]
MKYDQMIEEILSAIGGEKTFLLLYTVPLVYVLY